MRQLPVAPFTRPFNATHAGRVIRIDNRRLARVAKLAGAPRDSSAGLVLHARVGNRVEAGQPLFTLHAEAKGELEYAMAYATGGGEIIALEEKV
jgi:thymidine phosphorylase